MKNLKTAWLATHTRRWHTNAHLSGTHDSIGGHQGRVAIIINHYWPEASKDLIICALLHDQSEYLTGDIPAPAKQAYPDFLKALRLAEKHANDTMGIGFNLSPKEVKKLDFADKLDAYLWMEHHQPQLATRPDWLDAREYLAFMADNLGVELP